MLYNVTVSAFPCLHVSVHQRKHKIHINETQTKLFMNVNYMFQEAEV